ncbi:MAG: hypothetical protein ACRD8O_20350 [Bryobacteraceae bacterium]
MPGSEIAGQLDQPPDGEARGWQFEFEPLRGPSGVKSEMSLEP